jgi:hypothetical protein
VLNKLSLKVYVFIIRINSLFIISNKLSSELSIIFENWNVRLSIDMAFELYVTFPK